MILYVHIITLSLPGKWNTREQPSEPTVERLRTGFSNSTNEKYQRKSVTFNQNPV